MTQIRNAAVRSKKSISIAMDIDGFYSPVIDDNLRVDFFIL